MAKSKLKLQQGLAKFQSQKTISDRNKKAEINTQPYLKKKPKTLDRYDPARLDQGKSNLKEKLNQLSEAKLKGYNKERLKHSKVLYEASDKILLLGEGNFSFSSALCKMFGNGSNVWATSYDSEDVLKQKYSDDCVNHIEFVKGCGGKVFYGIDGTKLEKHRKTFLLAHNNEVKEQEGFVQNSFGSNFRNTNEIFFDKIVINFSSLR
ncbi:hypothetical protein DSO57_1005980 [Entomophthora muscae]|uniref:Uncharacterized protein n=1 Tax=Entomophthora muscae TaxID=34485 RepID=A0ACC2SKQ1_9FUNG|nr:hypothetical protein DSO57_1005980 [Entomophthora muscae]